MCGETCARVAIFREQPDGIQRETIYVHDLVLPAHFAPCNQDGEVVAYRLAALDEVAMWLGNESGEEVVTADAALVIADWLLRHGWISSAARGYAALLHLRGGERPAR